MNKVLLFELGADHLEVIVVDKYQFHLIPEKLLVKSFNLKILFLKVSKSQIQKYLHLPPKKVFMLSGIDPAGFLKSGFCAFLQKGICLENCRSVIEITFV